MNKKIGYFVVVETPNSIQYTPLEVTNCTTVETNMSNESTYIIHGIGVEMPHGWEVFDSEDELLDFMEDKN